MKNITESQKKILESKEYPFKQDDAFNLISGFLDENDTISKLETLSEKPLSVQIKDGKMNFGYYDPDSYLQSTVIVIENEKEGNDYYVLSDDDILKASVRYFVPKVVERAEKNVNTIYVKELMDIDYRGRGRYTDIDIAGRNVRIFVMGKAHHQDQQKAYYIPDFDEDVHEENLRKYFDYSEEEFNHYLDSKEKEFPLVSEELEEFNRINKKRKPSVRP